MKHNLKRFKKTNKKGFTLLELIIIFAISAIILSISVSSFGNFNSSQIFNGAVSDVVSVLNSARSRSISQVKPPQCSSSLDGYEVKFTTADREYEQSALCGGVAVATQQKKLPAQVSFVTGSAPSVPFNVSVGTVNSPRTIAVTGYGKTSTISINTVGIISVSPGLSLIAVPAATPTPTTNVTTPTPTPTTGAATPTPTPSVSQLVPLTLSISPNPVSSGQDITLTLTVNGGSCTTGVVYFYKENEASYFTGAGTTTGVASVTYPASYLGIGTHPIYARYNPYVGGCTITTSSTVNLVVQ